MHAVLQESIRMVTTVPVNQRVNLDEDVTIGGQVRHSYSRSCG
jgi:cytochrome P450